MMVIRKSSKFTALLIVLLMTLGLSGCSKTTTPAQKDQKPERDHILIGRVNPTTGIIAGFGEGTPGIEEKAIEAINKEGGIFITEYNKKLPIKLITVDSESNSTKASEAASKLILQDKVDLLIGAHTPMTVNPVSAVAERYKVPSITVDNPVEVWLEGGPYKWTFHAGFTVAAMTDVYVDIWDIASTNKKVGLMFDNQDGSSISAPAKAKAIARGYSVVDPDLIPVGTKDFTSTIDKFKREGVEIIVGNMNLPDFATAWKQFQQRGYLPKVVTMGRAVLFPSDMAALGELGEGLASETWWSENHPFKSSLTGQTAIELGKAYTEASGKQPSAVTGFKHAAMEIAIDSLKRAQTLDKDKLREAIKATNLDTVIGHIQYNDKNYSETPLVGGQWIKGKTWPWEKITITNKLAPSIPLSKESMINIPGSK